MLHVEGVVGLGEQSGGHLINTDICALCAEQHCD